MKKIVVFGAILSCVAFLGMKFYDSHASINAESDYTLRGESGMHYETISMNTSGNGSDYTLKGEPNTYYETFPASTSGTGTDSLQEVSNGYSADYTLRGELNTYYETFPAIPDDTDSGNLVEMYSENVVIAEPTPLHE